MNYDEYNFNIIDIHYTVITISVINNINDFDNLANGYNIIVVDTKFLFLIANESFKRQPTLHSFKEVVSRSRIRIHT